LIRLSNIGSPKGKGGKKKQKDAGPVKRHGKKGGRGGKTTAKDHAFHQEKAYLERGGQDVYEVQRGHKKIGEVLKKGCCGGKSYQVRAAKEIFRFFRLPVANQTRIDSTDRRVAVNRCTRIGRCM